MDEKALHNILEEYQKNVDADREKALEEALRIEKIAREEKLDTLLAKSLLLSGRVYYRNTLYDKSLEKILEALPLFSASGLYGEEGDCRNLLAVCQYKYGDYAESLNNAFEALKLTRKTNNRILESTCCNTIGNCYLHLTEFQHALDYFNLALKIKDELSDEKGRGMILINLGNVYFHKQEYETAEKFYTDGLEIKKKYNDFQGLLICYNNLGNIAADYYVNSDKAMEYYNKSLQISRENNFDYYEAEIHFLIAAVYYNFNEYQKSLDSLEKCSEIAVKNNYRHIMRNMYETYAQVYFTMKEFEKACEYYSKSYELVADTYKESSNSKIEYLNVLHKVELAKQETEFHKNVNEELKAVNEQLLVLNNEKNEFLGIAAHDLQNPLNSISLSVSALRRLKDKYTPEQVERKLEQIETVSIRMQEIIKNLLDINAIESGNFNVTKKPMDINKILNDVISENSIIAEKKNIKINFKSSMQNPRITGDLLALHEVFHNLISNTIKYSHPKSEVTIKCEADNDEKYLIMNFIDKGVGIREEEMNLLFKKFSKLSSKPTAGENSTGLGLSIVKRLVESMEGNIRCESTYGKGSNFIVQFELLKD